MGTNQRTARLMMAIASLSVPLVSVAADTVSGHFSGTRQQADTIEISKGSKLTAYTTYSMITSDNSALNGVGTCAGNTITSSDGKTSVRSTCTRVDKDGDTWDTVNEFPAGADQGTWQLVGGTGKFSGMKCKGWFKYTQREASKIVMGDWGGNCQ